MGILDGLNERQKEAVLALDGPLLIVAGAGSGKTKTIAHRIAYLVKKGTPPAKILAVTFTNRAAGEMRERIVKLLVKEKIQFPAGEMPFVGTFHALGASILRQHGPAIGISKNFNILDEEDSRQVMRDLIREYELDPDVYPPQRICATISRLKNELVDAASFAREAEDNPYQKILQQLYAAYEMRLSKSKNLDFDDLLQKTVLLFESSEVVREFYEHRWDYIHIDEYQDTNQAQYILSRMLASRHGNIVVVGDIDQAIYSWRGADWRNILQFERDWPGTRVILLEENYRSTKIILEAANAVIVNNRARKEKNLWSQKDGGELIYLKLLEDERQEALFIAEYIGALKKAGGSRRDVAVLFRTNAQSRAIEEAFLKKNIPYRLYAGVKFYERKEIKDVLAYLKLALNSDDIVSKKRILNTPPRGIGKVTQLKYLGGKQLTADDEHKIKKFDSVMERVRDATKTKKSSEALKTIIREAGFADYFKGNKLEEDRRENINELLSVTKKFDELPPPEGIEKLLTEASLMSETTEIDLEDGDDEVALLTAHAAKGLEFKIIIIAGMEEGLFPHTLSETAADLEEERRLFYVALTRAKEKIIITLARRRLIWGNLAFNDPSRFLGEIPEHLYESAPPRNNSYDFEE